MHRHPWIVAALSASLVGVSGGLHSVARAQDAAGETPAADAPAMETPRTANELFEQGLREYAAGDTAAARRTFDRVDEAQLSRSNRNELRRVREQLRRGESPRPASNAASSGGNRGSAGASGGGGAGGGGAGGGEAGQARRLVDEASADLKAGRLADAERKLRRVQDSGVDLGWFDNERVERQLAQIAERRQEAGMAVAPDERANRPATGAADNGEGRPGGGAFEGEPASRSPGVSSAEGTGPAPGGREAGPTRPQPAQNDVLAQAAVVQAQAYVEDGRRAENAGQLQLAERLYQQAVNQDPDNHEAADRLEAIRSRLGSAAGAGGSANLLERQNFQQNVLRDAALADASARLNNARAQLRNQQFDQAASNVQQARTILDQNLSNGVLTEDEHRRLYSQATDLGVEIQNTSRRIRTQRETQAAQEAEGRAIAERREIDRRRDEQVNSLLLRARDLQRAQNYTQSLELIDQALFLAPQNPAAQLMKVMVEDADIAVSAQRLIRERDKQMTRQQIQNFEATTPYSELLNYPTDWPAITVRRKQGLEQDQGESEVNRRVNAKLQETIPLNFDATKFENVVDFFRNTTGLNFYVNWTALQQVGVERDVPVTLQLSGITAERALRLVLGQVSATDEFNPVGFSVIEGIVTISTIKDLTKVTETRVYDIRDLIHEIPLIEDDDSGGNGNGNGTGSNSSSTGSSRTGGSSRSGGGSSRSGGGSSRSGGGSSRSGGGGGSSRSSRSSGSGGSSGSVFGGSSSSSGGSGESGSASRDELLQEIQELIVDTVGQSSDWNLNGGTVSSLRELNGNLIVKTTPEYHREIVKLLTMLRETRAMQIAVEARFLLVDQNFMDEFGIDLDVQLNNVGGNFSPIKIAQDTFGLSRLGSSGIGAPFLAAGPASIGTFTQGSGFSGSGRSLDFGVSYLDDLQVNLFLRASQAQRRGITLNAPRVTFMNSYAGLVDILNEVSYISDLEPVPDAFGFNPELDIIDDGVTFFVRGTVSADRRYVTLTTRPELTTLTRPIRTIPQIVTFTQTGQVPNPTPTTNQNQFVTAYIEAPETQFTSVDTTVSVPDRGTILLGGQRLVGEAEIEAGVPVLSKIPLVNRLFTNRSVAKDERTLLILIKPTIIIQSEEEENLFPGLQQNPEQYNVGLRSP